MPSWPGQAVLPNSAQLWLIPKYLSFVKAAEPHTAFVTPGAADVDVDVEVDVVVVVDVAVAVPGRHYSSQR